MNIIRFLLIFTVLTSTLTNCKKDDGNNPAPTAASQTELLVATNWQVTSITTPDGTPINYGRLNTVSQILPDLKFQFKTDNTVRALDPAQSNTVKNAGTWFLAADNKSIDVDVTGFKGNFPLIELTKNKLILRQRAPVDGKDADINLNFEPAL